MTDKTKEYLLGLLTLAQSGDNVATDNIITYIRDNEMKRRIGRYLHKNRQVEDEDLKQEFLIGVAFGIKEADLTIGNPIEFLISKGVYRVRSYLRRHILKNTSQVCHDCGYESRLNMVNGVYECKKCKSHNIETRELYDHDETIFEGRCDDSDDIEKMIDEEGANDIIERFRQTLDANTKVHSLFVLLYDEDINSDNPEIVNYVAEIAKRWGTSQTLVLQTKEKLKTRLIRFCENNGYEIKGSKFIQIK